MGYRVSEVRVELDVYVEFQGWKTIKFQFQPHADDALVKALLERNTQMLAAAQPEDPPTMGDFFIG